MRSRALRVARRPAVAREPRPVWDTARMYNTPRCVVNKRFILLTCAKIFSHAIRSVIGDLAECPIVLRQQQTFGGLRP